MSLCSDGLEKLSRRRDLLRPGLWGPTEMDHARRGGIEGKCEGTLGEYVLLGTIEGRTNNVCGVLQVCDLVWRGGECREGLERVGSAERM